MAKQPLNKSTDRMGGREVFAGRKLSLCCDGNPRSTEALKDEALTMVHPFYDIVTQGCAQVLATICLTWLPQLGVDADVFRVVKVRGRMRWKGRE